MFTGLNKPYSLQVEQRTSLNRKEACLLAGAESVVSGLLEHFVEVLEWGGPWAGNALRHLPMAW